MAINYKKCPKCTSLNVLKILYGYPTPEAFLESKEGKFKLGGCCVDEFSPEYYCKDCENAWGKWEAIEKAYNDIKGIKTSVGGFFNGYYEVEIDFVTRKLTWKHFSCGNEEFYKKIIRQSTVDNLIEQLKKVDLLNWKSKYIEPGVCDGTQWYVEITRDGRKIKKYGDNKFPYQWDEFCKVIRKISNRTFV